MISDLLRMEPNTAVFPASFISKTSTIVIKLVNTSSVPFRGEWRKYSNTSDEKEILKYIDEYSNEGRAKVPSLLNFKSENFSFPEKIVEIGPNRSKQIVVSFTPKTSGIHRESAFLYNTDNEERIELPLHGEGRPPVGVLNIDSINTGHILLDNIYEYQFILENSGEIPFDFVMKNEVKKDVEFQFNPLKGHLNTGDMIPINCKLLSRKVGQFNEIFPVTIIGAENSSPTIIFRGRIIGPTYEINPKKLNFGNVSYGFLYTQRFEIKNTSDIPLDYSIKAHHEKTFDFREFDISPNCGIVSKHSSKEIKLEFMPIALRDYALSVTVENPKFENILATIPIRATCICPDVIIATPTINIGDVYIGQNVNVYVVLQNKTCFQAKYELVNCDDASILDADFDLEKKIGTVNANGKTRLKFSLTPKQVGVFQLTRYIKIQGSEYEPLKFIVNANCIGPTLVVQEQSIDFGNCTTLQDYIKEFVITNNSPIPAPFEVSVKEGDSFSITPETGSIPENSEIVFKICTNVNDTTIFTGSLFFIFKNLSPITIPMKAKGVGCPIISSIPMESINMDYSFIGEITTKSFSLCNRGRRSLEIKWDTVRESGENKKMPHFTITPLTKVISPDEKVNFVITLTSQKSCQYSFNILCSATSKKKKIDLYKTNIMGAFIQPVIEIEKAKLNFVYVHDAEKEEALTGNLIEKGKILPSKELMKPIVIHNSFISRSELALTVFTECSAPFKIIPDKFETIPNERNEFDVIFDPSFKTNFLSELIQSNIYFKFKNNPQTFNVSLVGDIRFPNITFQPKGFVYDFGTLIKNTEAQKSIYLENTSDVKVEYNWSLQSKKHNSINTIFDIIPIRGSLEPGQKENISVNFFAYSDKMSENYQCSAICHVIGGPDYVFTLKGKSAPTDFIVSPTKIDLGTKYYNEMLHSTVVLKNKSLMPLPFKVRIGKNSHFASFDIHPLEGELNPKGKQVFDVSIVAGLPQEFNEHITIQVGSFEEVEVEFNVNCCFPQLQTDMIRSEDDVLLAEFIKRSKKVLPEENNNPTLDDLSKIERNIIIKMIQERGFSLPKNVLTTKGNKFFTGKYSSSFVVDMEKIIIGENRVIAYHFRSITPIPVSFEIFTSHIVNTGFSITSSKYEDINPDESFEIIIEFNTEKRVKDICGPQSYNVPLVFKDETAYLIQIKADLEMPELVFSKMHLDFEPTILGQKRVETIQIQNNNKTPVTYTFGAAEALSVVQRARLKGTIFSCSQSEFTLEPESYINLDIIFTPKHNKQYSMQFPVTISNNNQTYYITVKGCGTKMSIYFDPPEITFPTTLPFNSDPIEMQVDIVNPTQIPVTVCANQFDFQLLADQLQANKMLTQSGTFSCLDSTTSSDSASKFTTIIIVHGPPKSGKTSVAKVLQSYLNLPIVNTHELFEKLPKGTDPVDYVRNVFRSDYNETSLIIDGLDGIPEPYETDSFITQTLKHKNIHDEIQKNPLITFQHSVQTSYEQTLNYYLCSMQGCHVFGIFLQSTDEVLLDHIQKAELIEKQKNMEKRKEEINSFFNMTEEEYAALSDSEKTEVDKTRSMYRKEFLEQRKDGYNSQLSKKNAKPQPVAVHKPKGKGKSVPVNSIEYQNLIYKFTLGNVVLKMKDSLSLHQVVDPVILFDKNETISLNYSVNCLFVDTSKALNDIEAYIKVFIPDMDLLREKVLETKILPGRVILPSEDSEATQTTLENKPLYFGIVNKELPIMPPRPPQEKQTHNPRKPRGSRRQNRDTPLSTDDKLFEDIDLIQYTKRLNIPAQGKITITICFTGHNIGRYKDKMTFSIVDSTPDIYTLPLSAEIKYPDFDRSPESMFNRIVRNPSSNIKNAYISSLKQFHFGAVVIQAGKVASKGFQPAYKNAISIHNPGSLPVTVTPKLKDNGNKSAVWFVDQKTITVQSEETVQVQFAFHPFQPDTYFNTLFLYVRDNPEVYSINLVAEATIPVVDVSPLNLEFDKVITSQEKESTIAIKNVGSVPSVFKLKGQQSCEAFIKFSCDEGRIMPNCTKYVNLVFMSPKAVQFKKQFQIDIMDESKQRVFNSSHINVNAEIYDNFCDIIYPKNEKFINFDMIKTNRSKEFGISLKCKGKYPLNYAFEIKKHARNLKISSMKGELIPGEKPVPITFTFKSSKEMKLDKKELVNLIISYQETGTIAQVTPICVSVISSYSKYQISPKSSIDFGPCVVNKQSVKSFEIINTGVFPFEFDISCTVETTPQIDLSKGYKKKKPTRQLQSSSKNLGTRRGKNSLAKQAFGSFSISPMFGSIQPGSSMTINVDFTASVAGSYKVIAHIMVTDTKEENNGGHQFFINAEAFVPEIINNSFDNIFSSQKLCLRADVNKLSTTAFVEDDKCLHFAPVCVANEEKVKVSIINKQPVPVSCDYILGNSQAYSLGATTTEIQPNTTEFAEIIFKPKTEGLFNSVFEARIKGAPKDFSGNLKFSIEGRGAFPHVELLEGSSSTSWSFGKTLVGTRKEKEVIIINRGEISASIAFSYVQSKEYNVLGITTKEPMILEPMQMIKVEVLFIPTEPKKSNIEITADVKGSKKPIIKLDFAGEGLSEDLLVDGKEILDDTLFFNDVICSHSVTKEFAIKNISSTPIRYQWSNPGGDFQIVPSSGHLNGKSEKRIAITFSSDKPQKCNVKAVCQWVHIDLEKWEDWDDSMTTFRFCSFEEHQQIMQQTIQKSQRKSQKKTLRKGGKSTLNQTGDSQFKVFSTKPEPQFTPIGSKKEIFVKIAALCDTVKVAAGSASTPKEQTKSLYFAKTMMHETRTEPFIVTNTSYIKLPYRWAPAIFKCINDNNTNPFSIEPSEGLLEPGVSTPFMAHFNPQEVDDFTCTYNLEIKGMMKSLDPVENEQAVPIQIDLYGSSNRPICFFDVPQNTEYLKRRHPSYTCNLPSNVKVVEIVADGIGITKLLKFNVINTTGSMYEATWHNIYGGECVSNDDPYEVISAHKSYEIVFSFTPKTRKIIESLWEFRIAEHNVILPLLIVGRIKSK